MRADPDKVAAITQMPTPQNKAALLRFIGMINYLSPFCDNISINNTALKNIHAGRCTIQLVNNIRNGFQQSKKAHINSTSSNVL
jgi:hypothetical protein